MYIITASAVAGSAGVKNVCRVQYAGVMSLTVGMCWCNVYKSRYSEITSILSS